MSDLEIVEIAKVGNTKPSRDIQYKFWFFTFNNYNSEDPMVLEIKFKEICKKYIFQEEIGKEGTKHLQGSLELIKKTRISELKKINNKIHWEKTNNIDKSIEYCRKDETRNGKIFSFNIPRPIKIIEPNREYQKFILNFLNDEPDDRSVYWFWEEVGNVGKSAFCKYLVVKHNAIFIDQGCKKDIMNTIFTCKNDINLVLIDIPRNNKEVSYKSIESIKNGLIYSPKYEGGYKCFNTPHLIVFSNYLPENDKLSNDRWKIFHIEGDYSVKRSVLEGDDLFTQL